MIILAFPGMGKTPLSKKRTGYIDLDYGYFRGVKGKRVEEREMKQFYARLAWTYHKEGWTVLCNEPFIEGFGDIVDKVFLPRNLFFSARKLGVSVKKCEEYVEDWKNWCRRNHIPWDYAEFGLDELSEKEIHRK